MLGDPGRIRVLLVARSLGEWWDRLKEKSAAAVGGLLAESDPVRLDKPITGDVADADLVAAAVPYFSRALNMAIPERIEFELPTRRMPVLVLHTAALVAVLRSAADPAAAVRVVVTEDAEDVLKELLDHEARYWRRTAAASGLPEDGAVIKPVVAVAALLGAGSVAEASEMVARVPELSAESLAERRRWARWLYGLYPPGADGRLGSLQPDLLAEKHVTGQLHDDDDLARSSLRDLPEHQAEHALTVLARAWAHQDQAKQIIADALNVDLAHLAGAAATVTLQTRSDLGKLLTVALRDTPAPAEELIRIAYTLPYPSVDLAESTLAATWRVRESLVPGTERGTVAEWSDRVGVMLSQLGRHAEARPFSEEAVTIYRELAAASPDRYRPKFGNSLANLGVLLSELVRPARASEVTQEAVTIFRELAEANPEDYRPNLAASLANLGKYFGRAGQSRRSPVSHPGSRRHPAATGSQPSR